MIRRALARPLVAAFALLLLYGGLSFFNDPRGYLGTDTGGKVAALRAMADHNLDPDIGYWAETANPRGDLHPLALTRHVNGRWLSVTTLPMLYAAVPLYEVGGLHAVVLLPMLGAVLTALAARALARRLGAGTGMFAFWAVGVATPVAVYALDFWEHSLGLAAMLWAVVLLVDVVRAVGGWRAAVGAGALFGVAGTMRTEALVYAAVAVAATALMVRTRDRSLRSAVRTGVLASIGLAGPLALNVLLERSALGTAFRATRASGAALSPGGGGGSRFKDALTTTVGLNHFRPTIDWLFGAAVALLIAGAMVFFLASQRDRRRLAMYPLLAAVFLYALRVGAELGFIPGLLIASPLAAAGMVVLARRTQSRLPAAIAIVALPVVWFFQYSGGANPQWGGRYVLLSGAVLAVLAVTELATVPRLGRLALCGLALAVTASGVAWLAVRSHGVANAMSEIAKLDGPVVSREYHLFREGGAFYNPSRRWLNAPYARDLPRAVRIVREAGFDGFTLVGAERGAATEGAFQRVGSRRLEFLPGFDLVLTTYERT